MSHFKLYVRRFRLGLYYDVAVCGHVFRNCQFIKVTRKGFNFYNPRTASCILPHHIYAKEYGGVELPGLQDLICWNLLFWVSTDITAKTSANQIYHQNKLV